MKILSVDDKVENLCLLEAMLPDVGRGYEVVSVHNGVEALHQLEQHRFDLIISDILMPQMDGYETAQRFKNDPALAGIPLAGVSSFAMVGDRAKALQTGFAGCIEKPISTDTFARDITRFLKSQPNP